LVTVIVKGNNVEKALRVLKKKVQKNGLLKELRDRQYYQKPSEIKRAKKKEQRRNFLKNQAKKRAMLGI